MHEQIDLTFTSKQDRIFEYWVNERPIITVLEGAIRSGKTQLGIRMWYYLVLGFAGQGRKFIMVGATLGNLKRNVLDDMQDLFGIDTSLNSRNEFKMLGNTICCFGGDQADSFKTIKGFTAYGAYINEATDQHKNTVDQVFKRCSGPGYAIIMDTNPSGPQHEIKTRFVDRDGERLNNGHIHIKSFHFRLDDNEKLTPEYIESIKKNTPTGMWYDRDVDGIWCAAEGIIYRDFDYGKHVLDVVPKDGFKEYFAGVDWGFEHSGVIGLYGRDHDGNCVRIKEVVENGRSIEWWAQVGLDMQRDFGRITFYCDPARPDNISYFASRGLWARPADNEVVEGITFVAEQFRLNHLYIVRDTNRTYLSEIYNYRWKQNNTKEEPIKEDDHSMDSERYALYSHIGKRRQIKATVSLYR